MHTIKFSEEALTKTEKRIYNKLKEIRQILAEDKNKHYLSIVIGENGSISANNEYWNLPKNKGIDFYISEEEE